MNVIIVTAIEHFPREITLSEEFGSLTISVSGEEYDHYEHTVGVFASADKATQAIEKYKRMILTKYGDSGLDDETEEMHRYFTFSVKTWDVEEGGNE